MQHKFSARTATAIIVANMIGTGVFTSLGFQLVDIQSGFAILLLWTLGGIAALCGALCYAELGAAMPRSGGEYTFLSQIVHPAAGFVSGWVSASIGFAAPVALAAITFAAYALSALNIDSESAKQLTALSLVTILTLIHVRSYRASAATQQAFTAIKISVIILFCGFALWLTPQWQNISFLPSPDDSKVVSSGAFAVSLIYVSYAYTGWNAATYLSGEMSEPQKNLPRVLIAGTLVVTLLYLALNSVFLLVAPIELMQGQLEIGYIVAEAAFGSHGAKLAGLVLAALLISTVSAMTVAGPRVLQMIGQDFKVFRVLGRETQQGIPYVAVLFQSGLAMIFIVTASFDSILVFSGFTLALNSFVTILSLFVLRHKRDIDNSTFTTPLFPLPPLIYLAVTGGTLIFVCINKPIEALSGVVVIATGLLLYMLSNQAAYK